MIITHTCGHQSDILRPELAEIVSKLPCPACAGIPQVQLMEHPAGAGWVQHHIALTPPVKQSPPSRQQRRAARHRQVWQEVIGLKKLTRRERRAILRDRTRGVEGA